MTFAIYSLRNAGCAEARSAWGEWARQLVPKRDVELFFDLCRKNMKIAFPDIDFSHYKDDVGLALWRT